MYVAGARGLYAFDREGRQKWHAPLGPAKNTPAVAADGTVYFVAERLHAFTPDGIEKWSAHRLGSTMTTSSISLLRFGSLCFTQRLDRDQSELLVVAPTGRMMWRLPIRGHTTTPVVDRNGDVLVTTSTGEFLCVSRGGELRWRYISEQDGEWESTPVVGNDGCVHVGTSAGLLTLSSDGEPLALQSIGNASSSAATMGPGGTVVIGTEEGWVHAIAVEATCR